jgi:hypothetical protein
MLALSPGASSLIYHGDEGDGVDGVKGAMGSGFGSVSPPTLTDFRSFLYIM